MSATMPITRSGFQELLRLKYFVAIPYEMLLWTFCLKVSPSAQKVLLLHIHTATVQTSRHKTQHYISELSVNLIADALDVSIDAVNKAHRALSEAGVIDRERRRSDDAGDLTALTHLKIPVEDYEKLTEAPNRQALPIKNEGIVGVEEGTSEEQPSPPARTEKETAEVQAIDERLANLDRIIESAQGDESLDATRDPSESPADHIARLVAGEEKLRRLSEAREILQRERAALFSKKRKRDKALDLRESAPLPKGCTLTAARNKLTPEQTDQVSRAVATARNISHRKGGVREITFQLTQGVYGKMPFARAINVIATILHKNRWRTPIGYHATA